jgi:CYTH domain-containing protein
MTSRPTDRPTHRPYARVELERRFLLAELPRFIDREIYERLDDLYVAGNHLRLRRVHRPDGTWITTKLGQKIPNPAAPTDPRQRQMTTLYLPEAEEVALARLVGLRTRKRRYHTHEQGLTWCIDLWEAPAGAKGTLLAEVEAPSLAQLAVLTAPRWVVREVTDEIAYSAITLAARG